MNFFKKILKLCKHNNLNSFFLNYKIINLNKKFDLQCYLKMFNNNSEFYKLNLILFVFLIKFFLNGNSINMHILKVYKKITYYIIIIANEGKSIINIKSLVLVILL